MSAVSHARGRYFECLRTGVSVWLLPRWVWLGETRRLQWGCLSSASDGAILPVVGASVRRCVGASVRRCVGASV
ncbi:hypothetical protein [Xylella fastidiosa]|nr:hypothetical protein [Xylella fastidiosa]MDG5823103.1 hypothetical protein [Xylella fastidiosa subsp. pauca]MDG5826373.1 hypothetical protein [Xylella fastidiosa subsp. pauca]